MIPEEWKSTGISRRKYGTLSEARLLATRIAYRTQRRLRGLQTFSSFFFVELNHYAEKEGLDVDFEVETSGVACRLLPRTVTRES